MTLLSESSKLKNNSATIFENSNSREKYTKSDFENLSPINCVIARTYIARTYC